MLCNPAAALQLLPHAQQAGANGCGVTLAQCIASLRGHNGQRRAQLMRGICQKLALRLQGLALLGQVLVHRVNQGPHLRRYMAGIQRLQIIAAALADGAAQGLQGP
ncbi:hypothetical protein D3C71_1716680 [compost metagenome]